MPPCHPFRPVPGQCGPSRRGPLPAPPFDPRDYWATKKFVSSLFESIETKIDKFDVVDPSAEAEAGKAADAKGTYEGLNRVLGVASDARVLAESKADKLSSQQLAAVNSGIDASKVAKIAQNESAISAEASRATTEEARLQSLINAIKTFDAVVAGSLPSPSEQYSKKLYLIPSTNPETQNVKDEFICVKVDNVWGWEQVGSTAITIEFDNEPTEGSQKAVRSGGIWSWVKSLLPHWLTSDYAEPATVASVEAKADQSALNTAAAKAEAAYNVANGMASTVYSHVDNKSNPHAVTAAQIGAYTRSETDAKLSAKFDKTGGRIGPTDETGEQILPQTVVRIGRDSTHNLGSGGKLTIASGSSSGGDVIVSAGSQDDVATLDVFGDIYENSGEIRVHRGISTGNGHLLITHTGDGNETLTDRIRRDAGSLVSTNNPAFVSAVQNTPTSGMPEDMPTDWGTFGAVGAALAALATGLKWCKNILGSLASGYSTFAEWIASKLDRSSLLTEYSPSSAYSVGAIVYHDGNIYQCKTAIAEGGEAWNAEHWELRKLEDFFTESNSLLNGRLTYSRNETGLKDRAFNALTFDGTEYNLSTALAAVTPTASGQPRDLLIVATATAATTISFTASTIKGDKPTIDGVGKWLITLTEFESGVWYCRQIKMEDAA